jgi:hypothetical protein
MMMYNKRKMIPDGAKNWFRSYHIVMSIP